VLLRHLWLTDFRSYESAEVALRDGLTAVVGPNGRGKSNLIEALAFLATLSSFRGVPNEAMVRAGSSSAVVRAEVERAGRELLLEAEVTPAGRTRVLVNRQRLRRGRDLLGALQVTVFSPDDLALVKGGPAERRRFLDDAVVARTPRLDVDRTDVDKVLRQRNALLKQAGGRLAPEVELTLDVWDAKLAEAGERVATARDELVTLLGPALADRYASLAGTDVEAGASYRPAWRELGLAAALLQCRVEDLRRGVSTVGPHRDDLVLTIGGLPARTHASQGEQRSLVLALRLAVHDVATEAIGSSPVLLLDDVFSELDEARSAALVRQLPVGQALLTTASDLPAGIHPEQVLRIDSGRLVAV
jgi:DNA replication and repair protein RecF